MKQNKPKIKKGGKTLWDKVKHLTGDLPGIPDSTKVIRKMRDES